MVEKESQPRVQATTRRKKKTAVPTPDFVSYTDHLLTKLAPMFNNNKSQTAVETTTSTDGAAAAALPAILEHLRSEAKIREDEKEAKKRRREEECPEQEVTIQKWGDIDLKDDGLKTINPALRTKLRGPFGDPQVWWDQEFCNEKVEPVVAANIFLRHLLGSDRVNVKTLRLAHSRYSILEVKHFSSGNSGVTRELDQDFSMSKDTESGEQVLSSRVRWQDVDNMQDVMDAFINRIIVTHILRYDNMMC